MYIYMYNHVYTHAHTHTCTHTHTHTHIYIHTYMFFFQKIYIYIHTHRNVYSTCILARDMQRCGHMPWWAVGRWNDDHNNQRGVWERSTLEKLEQLRPTLLQSTVPVTIPKKTWAKHSPLTHGDVLACWLQRLHLWWDISRAGFDMFNQLTLWNGTLRKQFHKEIFDKEIPI